MAKRNSSGRGRNDKGKPRHGKDEKRPAGGREGSFAIRDRSGKVHSLGSSGPGKISDRPPSRPARHAQPMESDRPQHGKRPGKPSGGSKPGGRFEDKRGGGPKPGGAKRGMDHRTRDRDQKRARKSQSGGQAIKLKATVDKNRKGFGFLIFENREYEDAFVPPREAESLFHGDRVEVSVDADGEVEGIRVLEHRFREVVGRYSPHPTQSQRGGWVIYERKRAREEIYVPEGPLKARANDWVRAKLHFHEKGSFPVTAEILEIFGDTLPASSDVGMIAAEYNLIEEHSQEAEKEARSMKLEIPGKDLEGRTDLRHVPFITIDGETARDFDDAVFVEPKKSGFILWVAIADVSHYVKNGTALDKEAKSRGTSVYFPERAFHMLPRALSENLCSLKPNEPRLAMVARIEFDRDGKPGETQVMEGVIESKRRATYNQIQEEWEANKSKPDWEYADHFRLYALIRKARHNRGSIDFDLPEAEVRVDDKGEVLWIKNRARVDSHRLIEEFMIAANEAVTVWMLNKSWPFVYRVHDEPSQQSLEKFQTLAATVGVHVSFEGGVSPKVMSDVVTRLDGHPAQGLLNMALLRAMRQAVYSSTHGIHYGLASEAYTHFTSPIRRYPDLVVHRLLRWALRIDNKKLKPLKPGEREELEAELAGICEHCSYRERVAAEADREAIRLKQVRIMMSKLGEEFPAKIVGMVDSGLFVQLADPYVEGLVSKDTMNDDYYEFNEERMIFFGRRKKRTFKIGDKIEVRVIRADLDKRQIDFAMVDSQNSGPSGPSTGPKRPA